MAKVLRHILAVLCLLAAVFFLLPLGMGILHFGMVWPAALLLLCAAWLTWPDFFRRLLRPKWLRALVGCVIAVCMTAILATLGKMAMAAADRPADGQDCTVVVLGCQVFPDGHPSLMLRGRISAAYDYLTAHPDALCVASGGQNGSEPISEAQCIRDTLVSMGIAPERILLEDQSASTEENLAFSAALLREKGLSTDVAHRLGQLPPAPCRHLGAAQRPDTVFRRLRQPLVPDRRLLGAGDSGTAVHGSHRQLTGRFPGFRELVYAN